MSTIRPAQPDTPIALSKPALPSVLMKAYTTSVISRAKGTPAGSFACSNRHSSPVLQQPSQCSNSSPRPPSIDVRSLRRRPRSIDITRAQQSSGSLYTPHRSSPLSSPPIKAEDCISVSAPLTVCYSPPKIFDESTLLRSPSSGVTKHPIADPGHRVQILPHKRFSFSGLNFLFSGKKRGRPTPNVLVLENRFCEKHIIPTIENSQILKPRKDPAWR